jgi:hypothetical protein
MDLRGLFLVAQCQAMVSATSQINLSSSSTAIATDPNQSICSIPMVSVFEKYMYSTDWSPWLIFEPA